MSFQSCHKPLNRLNKPTRNNGHIYSPVSSTKHNVKKVECKTGNSFFRYQPGISASSRIICLILQVVYTMPRAQSAPLSGNVFILNFHLITSRFYNYSCTVFTFWSTYFSQACTLNYPSIYWFLLQICHFLNMHDLGNTVPDGCSVGLLNKDTALFPWQCEVSPSRSISKI